MELTYNLDVDEASKWLMITPNREARGLMFQISEVGHFYAGPKFYTDRAGKEEFYLLYTASGRGVLRHRGETLSLERGSAALIYCRERQYYATDSEEIWDHYWLHFNGAGAQSYFDIINDGSVQTVRIEDEERFVDGFEGIMANADVVDLQQSARNVLRVTALLTEMVEARYSVRNVRLLTQHQERLDTAIGFIRAHYREDISNEDITEVAHLSKYYFVKLFRQYTGMTPHEYLTNYRVNQAKKLLRESRLQISEIAEAVGFVDGSNFSKAFRKSTGTTPMKFRSMRF